MVVRASRRTRQRYGDSRSQNGSFAGNILVSMGLVLAGVAVGGALVATVGEPPREQAGAAGEFEAALEAFEARTAAIDARLATVLERSDAVMQRLDAIEPGVGAADGTGEGAPLAAIEEQAGAVEDRVLAMLARSDLAMRQLAELDALRANEIARLEALRMPAWRGAGAEAEVDRRILEMMAGSGALEATLAALKDASATVTEAAATPGDQAAETTPAATADEAILRMVGGEAGLLGALDTLDRLRERMAGTLAGRDPAAGELRALGGMERTLRELLIYVEQVAAELEEGDGAAAAVPLPTVPELAELEGDDALTEDVRRLVEQTQALHARLSGAEG